MMKAHHAATFFNDRVQTVSVVFLGGCRKTYAYKTLIGEANVGDLFVVWRDAECRMEPSIVRITDVHPAPQMDADAEFEYKWLGQRLDGTVYAARCKVDAEFNLAYLAALRSNRRDYELQQLKNSLQPDSAEQQAFVSASETLAKMI